MKKSALVIGGVVLLIVVLGIAYVLRPPAEASAPVQAPALATAVPTEPTEAASAVESTEVMESATDAPTEVVEVEPTAEAEIEEVETEAAAVADGIFEIDQDQSEVSFAIDEILRGEPFTAVGTTDQVAGQISPNFESPAESLLGVIVINARTLQTDNNFRNRAIRNEILDTDDFEFITFEPVEITGLPDAIAVGDTITFVVIGNLTVRDIMQSATFEITLTYAEEGRLEGLATTTVLRSDYELTIPSVPSVADVSDEVILTIEFVAVDG
jgi:polyisoprenoid-binding protein YceI